MVYLFLANGFEEIEALTAIDILRRADADVVTVGVGGCELKGAHGVYVKADIAENSATTDGLEMVVLPGGPGTGNLADSKVVGRFVDYAYDKGVLIGAICAAPTVLGNRGLLRGKKAVVYPGCEAQLKGAEICNTSVCEDGNIITANGPGASTAFGLHLAARLKGIDTAHRVASEMQVREKYV